MLPAVTGFLDFSSVSLYDLNFERGCIHVGCSGEQTDVNASGGNRGLNEIWFGRGVWVRMTK